MKMIVGLGNPGKEYEKTKHNIGFRVVDVLAAYYQTTLNQAQCQALVGSFFLNGEKVLLVKPQTFMNDSGRSVKPLMDYYKIELADLIVIYDDMDLPLGKIRLRQKGSAGGHNGIKSLISHLGTQAFNRVRVAIDRPFPAQTVVAHVLSPFAKSNLAVVDDSISEAVAAVIYYLDGHTFMETMNQFNHH